MTGPTTIAPIRAIVTGASGMVGRGVILECLESPLVEAVLMINRAPIGVSHPKLSEIIHSDFSDLSPIIAKLSGYNALYFCAGVSSVGKSEELYSELTYDLTTLFAQPVLEVNSDMTICYVSGVGTDSTESGRQMWARVKGRTENALLAMPFGAAYMFRPGIIQPKKGVKGKSRWARSFYFVFSPILFILKLLAPHSMTSTVAMGRAMIVVTVDGYGKQHLVNRDINRLS